MIDDYINHWKIGTYIPTLKKAQMITFLFKEFPSFFKRLIPSGIFHSNYHLLSLDGHGFHAMINNITCATNWVGHDHIVISHVPCPTNPYMLIVSSLSKQFLGRECNGYKQYVCTKKMHIHYLGEKGIGLLFVPKNYQEWV